MQPSEKAGEPSMEDILASIRKIIADDPSAPGANGNGMAPVAPFSAPTASPALATAQSAPRGGASPGGPSHTAQLQMPPPASKVAPSHPTMSSLEQELADLLRDPVEVPPAARAVPAPAAPLAVPSQGSIPAAGPANSAPQVAAPSSGSSSGLTAWLRGKPKADPPPPPTEPEITPFLPQSGTPNDDAISAMIGAPPVQQSSHEPHAVAQASVSAPMIAPTIAKLPEAKSPEAPASMQAILERLNAPAGAAVAKSQPVPSSVKARSFSAQPAASARAPEATEVPIAPANRPSADTSVRASEPVDRSLGVASAIPAVSAPASDNPAIESATAAIKAFAEVNSAPSVGPVPSSSAAQEGAPPVHQPVPVEAITAPDVVAAAVPPVEVPSSAPVAATAAPSEAATSASGPVLEDMLAELLRPMVRQWLEETMRGALHKAIEVETKALRNLAEKS